MVQHGHHVHPLTPLITYSNEPFPPGSPPGHLSPDIDPKTGEQDLGTRRGEQRECGGVGNVLGMGWLSTGCCPCLPGGLKPVSGDGARGFHAQGQVWLGCGDAPRALLGLFQLFQPGVMGAEGDGVLEGKWGAERKGAGGHRGL